MRIGPSTIVISVITVALGLGVIWFFKNFDRVQIERNYGPTREARANDFLAAEMILTRLGVETRSTRRLDELSSTESVLIVAVSRRQFPISQAESQLEWVNNGGHLIVLAEAYDEQNADYWEDPILDDLGIWAGPRPGGVEVSAQMETAHKPALEARLFAPLALRSEGGVWEAILTSSQGAHAMTRPIGAGRITVLGEARFFTNQIISEQDNAAVLWALVRLHPSRTATIVHSEQVTGLWERMTGQAWMVLASGALLVSCAVWMHAKRFGPVLPEPSMERRRLLDHIEASGRFLWRHHQGYALVRTVRESLLRTLEFRHPGWNTGPELFARLADTAGLPVEAVERAFQDDNLRDEYRFTETIATLEKIRKTL